VAADHESGDDLTLHVSRVNKVATTPPLMASTC